MFKRGAFRIPGPPLALTLLGLAPFAGAAGVIVMSADVIRSAQAGLALLAYAAVMLSFLGGARWAAAMAASPVRTGDLALSMLGVFAGWGLVLYGVLGSLSPALFVIAAALFVAQWIWDAFAHPGAPSWNQGLRTIGAAGAVAALLAAAII